MITRGYTYAIILVALLEVVVTSCNIDRTQAFPSEARAETIVFGGELSESYTTKGLTELWDSSLFTMGVFAGYEDEVECFSSASPANDYFNNVRYTRSFLSHPFAGDDVCYWPFVGKLSFFAYAPYVSDRYLHFASDYVSGYPRMVYAPTESVTGQPDFCLASPVLDRHNDGNPIPLVFHHSLSKVQFSANYSGSLPTTTSNLYVKIDSIRICNVIGRKTVVMSNGNPCFEWQADSTCSDADRTSYLMDRQKNHQVSDDSLHRETSPATDNYINLSTENGMMYLLPQSMNNGNRYLEVTYGYYEIVKNKETLRSSVTTTCNLPAVDWEPAHSYRYKFTINLATSSIVTPTVTVTAWNDVKNMESNPQHIE